MADFDEVKRKMMLGFYELASTSDSEKFSGHEIYDLVKDVTARAIAGQACNELESEGFLLLLGFHENDQYYKITPKLIRAVEENLAPASDRVVSLDHNKPEYKEAVSSLEKVIEEFRQDHRLDNEFGHEKGALLKALEGGRELLDDVKVNVMIATALLVEPLKRIVGKYDQVLVGATAATALSLIMKMLGLL